MRLRKLRFRYDIASGDDVFGGSGANSFLDAICAFLIVIMPILQHYKGLIRNAGFSVMVIVFPFVIIRMLIVIKNRPRSYGSIVAIVPLMLYELYMMFDHGPELSNIAYVGFMIIFYWSLACGAVNMRYAFVFAFFIARIGSFVIVLQTVLYHIFHYHLRIIPTELLLAGSDRWIARSIQGIARTGELYRPSGLFLEPSHMVLYCTPILCLLLLEEELNRKYLREAAFISLGVILSTSGMGIIIVVALWALYFVMYKRNIRSVNTLRRILSFRTLMIIAIVLFFVWLSYLYIPFVRDAALRIFNPQEGSSIAISGRIRLANSFVRNLSGKSLLFGVSERAENIEFNLPGFHATLYKWGIVGVLLSYSYYMRGLFNLKGGYFFLTIIITILSFFSAHTHGTFYMAYFSLFILNGYYARDARGLYKQVAQ